MAIALTLVGFFIGLAFAAGGGYLLGPLGGAVIGFLVSRVVLLERRSRALEATLDDLARRGVSSVPAATDSSTAPVDPGVQAPAAPVASPAPPVRPETPGAGPESTGPTAAPPPSPSSPPPIAGAAAAMSVSEPAAIGTPKAPSRFTTTVNDLGQRLTAWFTTGNVPVKVGVILSFIGVAFFLKYAIDNELFTLPIEFRLLAVAAAGVALVVIGWRLRTRMRVYGISLQGGGIGILFLTLFAAFRIWQLVPAGFAFALLVALAAFSGALAVLQKARGLVLLGAIGGFLAPVLTSTGEGSHVALFSYYLVLNALIFAVAWFQAWRSVNLVGFVFTFVIGSFWGYRYYRPELFASTEPFLVIHFLLYQAIAIMFALRQPPSRIGLVDGTLVFGTPVIAFALQAALVRDFEYGLAISAAVLAVFYALLATWLHQKHGATLRVLRDSFIALAVAFATISIPLALDARWTATAWALEGAALVWVATRQRQHLANFAGAALIVFSGVSFLLHGWRSDEGWPVLNGNVLNGVLISLSALFAARRLEDFRLPPVGRFYAVMAWGLFAWGVTWWVATGMVEISDRLARDHELPVAVLFLAATAAMAAWLGAHRDWRMARYLSLLWLPVLALMALQTVDFERHFLSGPGWLSWPLALAVQAWLTRLMDKRVHRLAGGWHVGTTLLLTLMLAVEVRYQVRPIVPGAWAEAASNAIPGIIALAIWRFRERPAWPVPAHPVTYRALSLFLVAGQVLHLCVLSIALPGDPGPLPYLPVLNPLDLATVFAAVVAVMSLLVLGRDISLVAVSRIQDGLPVYKGFLAIAFFILTTAALLRGVHHVAGVPWDFDRLYDSVVAQTALSIYWGVLGFTAMVLGARRAHRQLWLIGAGFMALVVLKLFLVDLGNSGTIERIVSFIGVGVLLLVVGYFAPAPPRAREEDE